MQVALLLQKGVARHGKLYLWRCDRQGILGYKKKKKAGYCDVSALAVRRKQRKWLAEQQVSGGENLLALWLHTSYSSHAAIIGVTNGEEGEESRWHTSRGIGRS